MAVLASRCSRQSLYSTGGLCRRGVPSPGPARISERNAGQKESTGGCCRRTFLRKKAGSQIRARCWGSSEATGPKWQHASGPIHPARDEHGQGTRAGSWLDPASCRKMGTARAVVSHSPTSTVSPTWFPMGPPAVGATRTSETRRPWARLCWRAALSAVTMS